MSQNRVVITHDTDCAATPKNEMVRVLQFFFPRLSNVAVWMRVIATLEARRMQQNHADDAHVQLYNLTVR